MHRYASPHSPTRIARPASPARLSARSRAIAMPIHQEHTLELLGLDDSDDDFTLVDIPRFPVPSLS